MIVLLNGPLGIGKSTLAEALSESIDGCAMLDGDHLVAVNPPPRNEMEHLHSTIELLVAHHRAFGYRHAVIDHLWTSADELLDLRRRLSVHDTEIRCFLLTLPEEENLARIRRRQRARALDEYAQELRTVAEERRALDAAESDLGEPFDVSGEPGALVERMRARLGLGTR